MTLAPCRLTKANSTIMPVINDSDDSIRAPVRLASTTLQRSV
jgi:hypothetical protein